MDERVDRTEPRIAPDPETRATPVARRSRRRYWLTAVIVAAGLAGAGWYLWTHRETQPAPKTAPAARNAQGAPQPVGFATVDTGDIRVILNELGTVTSLDTVTVQTQISGQLQQYGFTEGQTVKKGDFLAQIDPRPYQAALDQALGTLAHDQGLLEQAKADLKRYQTLGRQDSIAQQQLEDQKYLVQQYTGTVQTDQGTVENAQLNVAYCHIVSPVTGQVGLRQIDPGNYVQTSSSTGLVVVTQMQPISVIFAIPEDNLQQIIQRLRAGATLTVEAYDRSNNTLLESGQLSNLDNLINTTTGTLNIRSLFQNPDDKLYPNQFVNIHLLVNTLANSVRVPVPAVQRGEPGTFVYLINDNNTVSVRPIKVGPTDGNFQAVTSGLQPGDRVVTDGTDRLRDGAAVTLPSAQPAVRQGGPPGALGRNPASPTPASPTPASPVPASQTTANPPAASQAEPAQPPGRRDHSRQSQPQ